METSRVTEKSPKLMPLYQKKSVEATTKKYETYTGNVNTLCTDNIYEKTNKLMFLDI